MPHGSPTADLLQSYAEDLRLSLTAEEAELIATELTLNVTTDQSATVYPPVAQYTFDPGPKRDPLNAYVSIFDHIIYNNDYNSLSDLTIAVKDNMAIAGVPMTCGTHMFSHLIPQMNATVVKRLLNAGATISGKTNMDALAYGSTGETSDFGPVVNPTAKEHVTGGSSSGSAALVAAGEVDAALGSDTGGSVRNPAAFCGVVGFKPTWDSIPRAGFVELSYTLDHIGVLANNVETLARVMDVMAGSNNQDQYSCAAVWQDGASLVSAVADAPDMSELTLGVLKEGFVDGVSEIVRTRICEEIKKLEDAGATIKTVSVPSTVKAVATGRTITKTEFAAVVQNNAIPTWRRTVYDPTLRAGIATVLRSCENGFTDFAKRAIIEGMYILNACNGQPYLRAQNDRARITKDIVRALSSVDILVTPSMPILPPTLGTWPDDSNWDATVPLPYHSYPANIAGAPSLSLPVGDIDGNPIGIQLTGSPGADASVVAIGLTIEHNQ